MSLADKRQAVRHLLDQNEPADASAIYYAFYHDDQKTQLITYPADARRAAGYVCVSRTGIDLFRPLVTMRLPEGNEPSGLDLDAASQLIRGALVPGAEVIVSAPLSYRPLLSAFIDIQREQTLLVYVLDRGRFEPIINVLVTRSDTYNGLPRFVIRQSLEGHWSDQGDVLASSGLNWQTPRFAEIFVHTKSPHRRQGLGRSVVAAAVQHVLDAGRIPIYAVASNNRPSIQLAESVGFVDLGIRQVLLEGMIRA